MKRILTPAIFLLACLGLLLPGCSNSSEVIANGLSVELTKIESAGDGTALVSWQIDNSNVVSYLLSHVTLKISLNGAPLGILQEKDPLPVPMNSNVSRTGKLTGLDAAASRALTEAVASGKASYKTNTQIVILIYGDTIEKSVLNDAGSVVVTGK